MQVRFMVDYIFEYKGKNYKVKFVLNKRSISRVSFKIIDNDIVCYAHPLSSYNSLVKVIEQHKLSLVHMYDRNQQSSEDYIYIFGEKTPIIFANNIYTIVGYGSFKNEVEKDHLLERLLNRYIDGRFYELERKMHVQRDYKYIIRKMKTRYGTNSIRTNRITFSLELVHFSYEIIDSVIIHELAHEFHRDHSQRFYNCVYQYCPNYDILRNKMVKGEFK